MFDISNLYAFYKSRESYKKRCRCWLCFEERLRDPAQNMVIREEDIAKRRRKIAGEEWRRKTKINSRAPRKRTGKQSRRTPRPTGHRIPDPHRLPSPPSLLPEPDQIHAAVSSDGSSPFPAAARGLRHQVPCGLNGGPLLRQLTAICHHLVGRGRKKRPVPVSEDVG